MADRLLTAHELVGGAWARQIAPPPALTVDEFAEKHRWLEKLTAAEAGPYRNARTPYLIEVQRVLTQSGVRFVVVLKGAQTGGSEVGLNWVLRDIVYDPGPMLWVTSTDAQVRKLVKRRLDPALEREPLRELVAKRKGRDADRTLTQVAFRNGTLSVVTAQSPASLSSDPMRLIVFDEVDRYAESSGKEGDPLELGLARQKTFESYGAKTLYVSTPGLEGTSRIADLYEDSDQRRYMVPCPGCGVAQELVWYGKRERDGFEFGVRWDRSVPRHLAAGTAYYQCRECDARWSDADRWVATLPESGAHWVATRPFVKTAGFYIPSLLSSFVRLEGVVDSWFKSLGKPAKQQAFWNLELGLPFSLTSEKAPETIPLEAWDFDVPHSAVLLLGMADVQKDRLEVTIAGLAPDETLCVVQHLVLQGATEGSTDVWDDLAALLVRTWVRSDGKRIALSSLGIDCSYLFEQVCDWAAQQSACRVFPLRGVKGLPLTDPIVKDRTPGVSHGGRRFYNVNPNAAKLAVVQRLNLPAGKAGRVRYPVRECFDDDYFRQLRSESLRRRYVRGYAVLEWVLKSGERNEALDCLAGIYATREWLNPALDVLALRNPKVSDAPIDIPAQLAAGRSPREVAEAVLERAEQRAAERAAAPVQPAPPVVKRHSGAWFDRGARR